MNPCRRVATGRVVAVVASIFVASMIAGCGGKGGSGSKGFTFRIVNNSGYTANTFYISSGGGWGANQLSSPLASGSTRDINNVSGCGTTLSYYGTGSSGAVNVTYGPGQSQMPSCGGTFTLTLT